MRSFISALSLSTDVVDSFRFFAIWLKDFPRNPISSFRLTETLESKFPCAINSTCSINFLIGFAALLPIIFEVKAKITESKNVINNNIFKSS